MIIPNIWENKTCPKPPTRHNPIKSHYIPLNPIISQYSIVSLYRIHDWIMSHLRRQRRHKIPGDQAGRGTARARALPMVETLMGGVLWTMGKPWGNHGETMGNHGKPWETSCFLSSCSVVFHHFESFPGVFTIPGSWFWDTNVNEVDVLICSRVHCYTSTWVWTSSWHALYAVP